jgi:hypothetical protein
MTTFPLPLLLQALGIRRAAITLLPGWCED